MKSPEECESLTVVRTATDTLDRDVVSLIGRRARYVEAVARFKTSEGGVRAPERQAAMLTERRRWADEEGLDPDAIETFLRDLIEFFVEREMGSWRARGNDADPGAWGGTPSLH